MLWKWMSSEPSIRVKINGHSVKTHDFFYISLLKNGVKFFSDNLLNCFLFLVVGIDIEHLPSIIQLCPNLNQTWLKWRDKCTFFKKKCHLFDHIIMSDGQKLAVGHQNLCESSFWYQEPMLWKWMSSEPSIRVKINGHSVKTYDFFYISLLKMASNFFLIIYWTVFFSWW